MIFFRIHESVCLLEPDVTYCVKESQYITSKFVISAQECRKSVRTLTTVEIILLQNIVFFFHLYILFTDSASSRWAKEKKNHKQTETKIEYDQLK